MFFFSESFRSRTIQAIKCIRRRLRDRYRRTKNQQTVVFQVRRRWPTTCYSPTVFRFHRARSASSRNGPSTGGSNPQQCVYSLPCFLRAQTSRQWLQITTVLSPFRTDTSTAFLIYTICLLDIHLTRAPPAPANSIPPPTDCGPAHW